MYQIEYKQTAVIITLQISIAEQQNRCPVVELLWPVACHGPMGKHIRSRAEHGPKMLRFNMHPIFQNGELCIQKQIIPYFLFFIFFFIFFFYLILFIYLFIYLFYFIFFFGRGVTVIYILTGGFGVTSNI